MVHAVRLRIIDSVPLLLDEEWFPNSFVGIYNNPYLSKFMATTKWLDLNFEERSLFMKGLQNKVNLKVEEITDFIARESPTVLLFAMMTVFVKVHGSVSTSPLFQIIPCYISELYSQQNEMCRKVT